MLPWHLILLLGESPSGPTAPTLWGVDLSSPEGLLLRAGLRGVTWVAIACPLWLTLVYLGTLWGARHGRSRTGAGRRIDVRVIGQGLSLFACALGLGFLRKYALTQSVWMLRGTVLCLLLQAAGVLGWWRSTRSAPPGEDTADWRPLGLFLCQAVGFHLWVWTSDYPDLVADKLLFATLGGGCALVLVWLVTTGVEHHFEFESSRLTGAVFFLLFIPGFVFAHARLGHALSRFEEAGQGHPFAVEVLDASRAEGVLRKEGRIPDGGLPPAEYFFLPSMIGRPIASTRVPTLQAWWRELPDATQMDLYVVAGEPGLYVTSPRPLPPLPSLKDFFTHWRREEDLARHHFIDR